jgi:hypothetical protein
MHTLWVIGVTILGIVIAYGIVKAGRVGRASASGLTAAWMRCGIKKARIHARCEPTAELFARHRNLTRQHRLSA